MMGFVKKDFLVMKKQLGYYLSFFLVYGVLGAMDIMPFGSVIGAVVGIIGLLAPMSAFAYDEQTKWERFAAATPPGRRGIVRGRYLFVLLLLAGASLLAGALTLALALTGLVEADTAETLLSILGCALAVLLMNSLYIPLLFKFGPEKARLLGTLSFVIIFVGIFVLSDLSARGIRLPPMTPLVERALAVFLVLVIAALLALSYRISLGIMRKKEL